MPHVHAEQRRAAVERLAALRTTHVRLVSESLYLTEWTVWRWLCPELETNRPR